MSELALRKLGHIMVCAKEECALYEQCSASTNCKLHEEYIAGISDLISAYVRDKKLNEHGLHVVANTLMPLYSHLFKFQLEEMGLESTVIHGKSIYMHPVFKEIRATTKTIMDIWKSLGFGAGEAPFMNAKDVRGGGYYAMMSQDEGEEEVEEKEEEEALVVLPKKKKVLKPTSSVAKASAAAKAMRAFMEKDDKKAYELEFGPEDVIVDANFDPTALPSVEAEEEGR